MQCSARRLAAEKCPSGTPVPISRTHTAVWPGMHEIVVSYYFYSIGADRYHEISSVRLGGNTQEPRAECVRVAVNFDIMVQHTNILFCSTVQPVQRNLHHRVVTIELANVACCTCRSSLELYILFKFSWLRNLAHNRHGKPSVLRGLFTCRWGTPKNTVSPHV